MAEIYQLPDSGSQANAGGIPFSIPLGNNGGLFGGAGGSLVDLFGFAIIASMFGWGGGNGFGGGFGGNGNGATRFGVSRLRGSGGLHGAI